LGTGAGVGSMVGSEVGLQISTTLQSSPSAKFALQHSSAVSYIVPSSYPSLVHLIFTTPPENSVVCEKNGRPPHGVGAADTGDTMGSG
jgi:hypothetical protein